MSLPNLIALIANNIRVRNVNFVLETYDATHLEAVVCFCKRLVPKSLAVFQAIKVSY